MVRIRLPDATEATLEHHHWHCENTRVATLLNAMLAPWTAPDNQAEADLKEAKIASKVLGAEIIAQD